ncbi:4684_t:CDS:2 [Dentiscutata heterogama]|uniref:4684_t:CDS:1 n=1 Tax=Dentiscutata heterogama TaxID=1316150 RepID=A0ACA9KWG2_9GLOM|nr:4684_t:CDS:2 [Dentiscutata heterogama]
MPPQPQNLDDIDIPDSLCLTLNKENFLVRDSIIGEDRIILFTAKANIQHLSRVLYWIMDVTFKTVLTIFHQLYTIHASIGTTDNLRVLSLSNILLRSTTIFTDFELAAINASHDEFPEYGLSTQYSTDEKLSINLCQLFALAFLPSKEIPAAFDILKEKMLPKTNEIVQCYAPPLFPPQMWSVHDFMEIGVYTIVTEFQKEQQQVEHQIETILCGAPEKQIQESSKHQTQQRTNTRKDRMSKTPNLAKNKHKKGENVQSTKPSEKQTQESSKHQTRQRTSIKKSKAPNLTKNKYKKVQSTKPGKEQTNTSRERKFKSPFP